MDILGDLFSPHHTVFIGKYICNKIIKMRMGKIGIKMRIWATSALRKRRCGLGKHSQRN